MAIDVTDRLEDVNTVEEFPYNLINAKKKRFKHGRAKMGGNTNSNLVAFYVMIAIIILLAEFCFISQVGKIIDERDTVANYETSIVGSPKVLTFLDGFSEFEMEKSNIYEHRDGIIAE